MSAQAGGRVRGVWGAMFPEWTGVIVHAFDNGKCLVVWDEWTDGGTQTVDITTERSANGSPVGVWLAGVPA